MRLFQPFVFRRASRAYSRAAMPMRCSRLRQCSIQARANRASIRSEVSRNLRLSHLEEGVRRASFSPEIVTRSRLPVLKPTRPSIHPLAILSPFFVAMQHDGCEIPLHQMTASAVGNTPEGGMSRAREAALRAAMHADEHLFEFKVNVFFFSVINFLVLFVVSFFMCFFCAKMSDVRSRSKMGEF